MARRQGTASARRRTAPAKKPRRGKVPANGPDSRMPERFAALERERNTLRHALEKERARRRQLETGNAAVRDRLAWALDTLHNILSGKG